MPGLHVLQGLVVLLGLAVGQLEDVHGSLIASPFTGRKFICYEVSMANEPLYLKQYQPDVVEAILEGVAAGGDPVALCDQHGVKPTSFLRWVNQNLNDFADSFKVARQIGALRMLGEIKQIADDCPPTQGHVARAKLQIAYRQRTLE